MREVIPMSDKPNLAKEYLHSVKTLDRHIDNKIEQLGHLKALATKITTHLKPDAAFAGGNQDKIGDAVVKIIELQEEINKSIDEYVEKKREVIKVIEQVKDPLQVDILYKLYIHYQTLYEASLEMGYTYRHVCNIHGRALQTVETILKEKGYENKEGKKT